MSDIFIGYSRHDQEWVGKFTKTLENAGYSIWWDTRLLAGDEFHDVIPAALEQASCVIVVWSKVSVTRKWVRAEASRAHDKDILIPIQIDPVSIPMPFNLLQVENMEQWNGKRNHPAFQRVVTSIDRYCRAKPESVIRSPRPETRPRSWLTWLVLFLLVLSLGAGISFYFNLLTLVPTFNDTQFFRIHIFEEQKSTEPVNINTLVPTLPKTSLPFLNTFPAVEPIMVTPPSGEFIMGCIEGRDDMNGGCDGDEKPAHTVNFPAFQIGKYEVTFDEWDACEHAGACPHAYDAGWERGKHPVINVSWNDITQKYIPWLNQQTGKRYRLPTEAEWEYAARAGGESAYPWGGNSLNCNQANYGYDSEECKASNKTKIVGSHAANAWGLYDMVGNVLEWVQDCYGSDYYRSSAASDPQGPSSGTYRLLRGGSWNNYSKSVRSASRSRLIPDSRSYGIGFRLALD